MKPDESAEGSPPSGLTSRSVLAVIFTCVFLLPVVLYLQLVSGALIVGATVYVAAVLFTEIARISGRPLSTQEVFIIYMASSPTLLATPFLEFVFRAYFVNSPYIAGFSIGGKPLVELIPSWYAPSVGSHAYDVRTLLSSQWVVPVGVFLLQFVVLWLLQEIALGYIGGILFVEEQDLPFPSAGVQAQVCITLAEREESRTRVFSIAAILGVFYATVVYVVPTVSEGLLGSMYQLVPIPWIDLTAGSYGIERILPGAALGVATDISYLLGGFVMPLPYVVQIAIGSIMVWVFGNWAARTLLSPYFQEWTGEWAPGMSLRLVYQRSLIRVWIVPFVVVAMTVAIVSLIAQRRYITDVLRRVSKTGSSVTAKGYPPLVLLVAMYLVGTLGSVGLFWWLVPDFPVILALAAALVGGLLHALVGARAFAETGYPLTISYMWQGIVLASGYSGPGPWLMAPAFSGVMPTPTSAARTGAPAWTNMIKTARLTNTDINDFFKAYVLAVLISLFSSFIFVSFFWAVAPIPSTVYPFTTIQWPVDVLSNSMWITGEIKGAPTEVILGALVLALTVSIGGELLRKATGVPFSAIALVLGVTMLPPYAITTLIGGLLGHLVIRRQFGDDWWRSYRTTLVAGLLTGDAVMIGLSVAVVMISKAAWVLPW
jgi:hypothetical protein